MRKRIAVIVLVGVGLAILARALFVAYRAAWRETLRSQCDGRLFQSAFEVASDYYRERRLPPARIHNEAHKEIAYSWRALTMMRYDTRIENDLPERYDFDQPWESPHNTAFMNRRFMGGIFACPADAGAIAEKRTSYVAVVGEDTLWLAHEFRDLTEYDPERLEEKILLIELPESDIPWTEPRDISLDQALALFVQPGGLKACPRHGGLGYITLGMAMRRISSIPTVEEFKRMLTIGPEDRKLSR
jgi:hypothetical protein